MTDRSGIVRKRVITDVALFVGFVAISAPVTTGIPVHEWMILGFIPIWFAHLILDWDWITSVFRRTGRRRPTRVRVNRALNTFSFVQMVVVIWSGFVIREAMLPALGIHVGPTTFWVGVHDAGSVLLLIATGAHLALHRDWIKRRVLRRQAAAAAAS